MSSFNDGTSVPGANRNDGISLPAIIADGAFKMSDHQK